MFFVAEETVLSSFTVAVLCGLQESLSSAAAVKNDLYEIYDLRECIFSWIHLSATFSLLSVHDFRTYIWTHFVSKKERNLWHPGPRGDSMQCAWGHPKRKWPYKNTWALQPQQGLPPSLARLHNLDCCLFRKYSYLMDFCFLWLSYTFKIDCV